MNLTVIKRAGMLIPYTSGDSEKSNGLPDGEMYVIKVVRPRNAAFMRKYFSLLEAGFAMWDVRSIEFKDRTGRVIEVEKDFDKFREDVTILCGYIDWVPRVNGEAVPRARSISFAKMEQEEFEKLYSKTIDVLLKRVLSSDITKEQLENYTNQILSYG